MSGRSARHRAIKRMGREVEVVNFDWSGDTDEYGDPTNFSESSTTTTGLVEQQEPEQVGGPDGADLHGQVKIYLADDVEVHQASDDDKIKATRVKDTARDLEWKVYDVFDDNQGVLTALCRPQ